jgi:hypothetical protein
LLIERYNEISGQKRIKRSEEITGFNKQDDRLKEQDNRMKEEDWGNKKEILLEVVRSRLKPVFLTTLTTVLGLVTLALKDDLW